MKIRKSLAVLGASAALAVGFGGVMAPSAQAHAPVWEDATYTQTDLRTGATSSGTTARSASGYYADSSTRSPHCWNEDVSRRAYTTSCSGVRWRAYVQCTNGRHYITPAVRGADRVTVYCPPGTRALRGGSFGR